jgi:hypothetical protein
MLYPLNGFSKEIVLHVLQYYLISAYVAKWSVLFTFSGWNSIHTFIYPYVVYTHFILDFITLLIFGEQYKLQSSSVSNFIWPTFWIQIQYYLTHILTCMTHTSLSTGYWLFNTVFKRPQSIKIPSYGKWDCMAVNRYKHCAWICSLHLQKMDPADFPETLVRINQTSWHHITENLNCNNHRYDKFVSHPMSST